MVRLAVIATLFLPALVPSLAHAHYEGELLPDSVAVMEYKMIINMKPDDTLTRNKLGMVYVRQGKPDKAREQFLEILKAAPDDFDALDSLGIVSMQQGDYGKAAEWFKRALDVRKDDPGAAERYRSALEMLKSKGVK